MSRLVKKGINSAKLATWNITDDGKGMLSGTARFFEDAGSGRRNTGSGPKTGSKHPYDERLYCTGYSQSFGANDVSYIDANYIGFASDPAGVSWSISTPSEEADIQTHPKFLKKSGKDKGFDIIKEAATEEKAAVFDSNEVNTNAAGDFESFANSPKNGPDGEKRLYGVRAYKTPMPAVTLNYKTAKQEYWSWTTLNVGKTYNIVPMLGAITDFSKGSTPKRNWLLTDASVTEESGFYNVSITFMASGGNGWNPLIYDVGDVGEVPSKPAGAGGAQWS